MVCGYDNFGLKWLCPIVMHVRVVEGCLLFGILIFEFSIDEFLFVLNYWIN